MKIYWYYPNNNYSLFPNVFDNPSIRLRVKYNLEFFNKDGHDAQITDDLDKAYLADILILLSFGEKEYLLTKYLKEHQKIVIHDYTENIRGIPILEKTKELCDQIICCSTVLAEKERETYPDKVSVIKDPFEPTAIIKNIDYFSKKVVWSGMGGNAVLPQKILKPIIYKVGLKYIEISNNPNSDYAWQQDTWQNYYASCDIAICPQDQWVFPAKSNVKVTTAMSLGLPVIASPIQSYLEIIDNEENGFIAYTLEDWEKYLYLLKDYSVRKKIVTNAFKKLSDYSVETIYKQWKNILKVD